MWAAFYVLGRRLAMVLTCATASMSFASAADVVVIHAGTLLAAPGEKPTTKKSIIVVGDRIQEIVDGFVERPGARTVDLSRSFVMPGMIDMHTHLQIGVNSNFKMEVVALEDAFLAVRAYASAYKSLEAGFTTLRDAGSSPTVVAGVRDAISQGLVVGPRIVSAGSLLVATGGGVVQGYREEIMEHIDHLTTPCSGVDDCRRAVRKMVQQGADVVKIVATGALFSESGTGLGMQVTEEELKAAIDAAHALGRRVAVHAHGREGINAALRAGADTIEHGTFGDESSMKLYREKGATVVPTLTVIPRLQATVKNNTSLSPNIKQKVDEAGRQALKMARLARESGVPIAFGTDIGVPEHGQNAQEFLMLREAGLNPQEMIRTATVNAARALGLENTIGTLEPGKVADLIATDGSPLDNIEELLDVDFVMKSGRVVKARSGAAPAVGAVPK